MEPETLTLEQQLYNFALETLQQGKDLAVEQAPLVIQDYLEWGFWSQAILAGGLFLGVLAALCSAVYFWRLCKEDSAWTPGVIISFAVAAGFMGFCIYNGALAVKVKVAPRAYIIDTILAKSKSRNYR